jgi:hypothetical protein
VGSAVDNVALGQAFLRVLLSPVDIIPPWLSILMGPIAGLPNFKEFVEQNVNYRVLLAAVSYFLYDNYIN